MNHRISAPYHQPTDPDPRFTTRGARYVNYHRPWDYLFVAILVFGVAAVFAGALTAAAITHPDFFHHPAVFVLWAVVLLIAAMGWWAMRRFIRWRRARIEWARLTGTAYRGIFVLSSQIARREKVRRQDRTQRTRIRAQQRAQVRASSRSRRS